MAGKVFVQGNLGVTQTIDSCKSLAHFLGLKEALPQVINLANGARLSLSSKMDCYYYTNSRSCSCRAGLYGKICKHRRSLQEGSFLSPSASSKLEEAKASVAQSRAQAREYQARQRELRAQVNEVSSQVLEVDPLIQRGGFKPFLEA